MTGQLIGQLILWLIVAVVVIAIIYWVMQWLYRRSTKEVAFVRTGFLGEKVVIDGGAFVLADHPRHHAGQHEHAAAWRSAARRTRR